MTEEGATDAASPAKLALRPPRSKIRLPVIGFVASFVWLAIIAALLIWRGSDLGDMALNEIGDFLAGVFAPLAFLWLVLGYLQQGEELRLNGDALWLQGQELQNSVEQQRELVTVTREQLAIEAETLRAQRDELDRMAEPIFRLSGGGIGPDFQGGAHIRDRMSLVIANNGSNCSGVELFLGNRMAKALAAMATGEQVELIAFIPTDGAPPSLEVRYLNGRRIPKSRLFEVVRQGSLVSLVDKTPE